MLLQLIPDIKHIYVAFGTDFGSIPLHQLHKFRFLTSYKHIFQPCNFMGFFECDSSYDVANEASFLKFLDCDTDVPGLKNGQMITRLKIGSRGCIEAGTAFSNDFILRLIRKTPNLEYFTIFSGQTIAEIKTTIDQSGHKFVYFFICGTNGGQTFFHQWHRVWGLQWTFCWTIFQFWRKALTSLKKTAINLSLKLFNFNNFLGTLLKFLVKIQVGVTYFSILHFSIECILG